MHFVRRMCSAQVPELDLSRQISVMRCVEKHLQ